MRCARQRYAQNLHGQVRQLRRMQCDSLFSIAARPRRAALVTGSPCPFPGSSMLRLAMFLKIRNVVVCSVSVCCGHTDEPFRTRGQSPNPRGQLASKQLRHFAAAVR